MKILFLPKWYPNLNDVQHGIFIERQAKAIAEFEEIAVLFVVTSESTKEEKTEIKRDGNYFSITIYFPKKSNRLSALYSYYQSFKRGAALLEKEWGKPEVVNLYILGRNYLMYKKFFSGIPFVVSEQWSGYLNGKMEKYIYAKRRNTLNALRKANAVIAVSKPLAEALKKYSGKNEIHIIPNIVVGGEIKDNVIGETVNVLTIADLDDEIKNISGMMNGLMLSSKYQKIHFKIIGEGKDKDKLSKLAESNQNENLKIEFCGHLPHDLLRKEFGWSNFYLLNSPVETFCVAAAEAIASGRPVISTNCGGPLNYLENLENGLWMDNNSAEGLAERVDVMIQHLRWNDFPARQVASTINEKYGADTIAKQYITVLNAAINKKKE